MDITIMNNRVHSFSTKPKDVESSKFINDLKILCLQRGLNFSHVVVEALKRYKEEVLDV